MSALWVATTDGLHVIGEPTATEFSGHEVNALARGGHTWWALVDRHELWRRADDGWREAATNRDLRLNCVSVHGDDVLVGTSEARLVRLAGDRLEPVKTFDDLADRSDWFTPWGGPPDVRSIARSGATIFANVHVGGIMRSDDDGTTWRQTIEIGSDVHEVIASEGLIAAATAWGLALSNDLGESWDFAEEGLHASYARAITIAGDVIVMSSSTGPRGGRAALYRKPISTGAFEKLDDGLPDFSDNINTGCVTSADERVAFATEEGTVFLSNDQGSSWEQIAEGIGAARWIAFD